MRYDVNLDRFKLGHGITENEVYEGFDNFEIKQKFENNFDCMIRLLNLTPRICGHALLNFPDAQDVYKSLQAESRCLKDKSLRLCFQLEDS